MWFKNKRIASQSVTLPLEVNKNDLLVFLEKKLQRTESVGEDFA